MPAHTNDLPACLPECDEQHAADCPREAAEMNYWRRYFGQDNPDREQRRLILEAMDPRTEVDHGE